MPLAKDLNDFINKFGSEMKKAAESVLVPRFTPGIHQPPNMKMLEVHRSKASKKRFQYFPSQLSKLAGAIEGLKTRGAVWMVCAPGTGKTAMSMGLLSKRFGHKPFRAIVMCPGHLVRKWQREVEWLIPNVYCVIIRKFAELREFQRMAKKSKSPMIAVIGKDVAKLGFDVDKPCATKKKIFAKVKIHCAEQAPEGAKNIRRLPMPIDGWKMGSDPEPRMVCDCTLEVASCSRCGHVQEDKKGAPIAYAEYIEDNTPMNCSKCGDRMVTNARGHRKNAHIDRYIQRKMRGVFDMMIADEVHELAGSDTIQGNTLGTIASACREVTLLTGTLIGGNAKDMHALLWRISPDLMRRRGFNITAYKGGKISAIARNERAFVKRYGVIEHQVVYDRGAGSDHAGTVTRGACGRRKSYKTNERPRPGISPDLFNHFLIDGAVFMNLEELGPALPSLERVLVGCKPSDELKSNYDDIDDALKAAIKEKVTGNGPPVLSAIRIQALDCYLDRPFGWGPIMAPAYDDYGKRAGWVQVAEPENLDENHMDDKDVKVLETVKSELAQGRRCGIYISFTGKHDVRPKLVKMIQDAGIKVKCLPDAVKPEAREDWIADNLNEMDVLICHPKRVMTGLDLIQFPSLIWYQVGYSTHVLRQASARARRPIQTLPCKVFYFYYKGTIQETSMALMGEKEAASQALEGTFDTRALKAMMNGGENDDIMSALARNLGSQMSAEKAWAAVDPTPAPAIEAQPNRMAEKQSHRTIETSITCQPLSKGFSLKPGRLFRLSKLANVGV